MSHGNWKIIIRAEREQTGQWFASWSEQKVAGAKIIAGIGPYADTRVLAIAAGMQIIIKLMTLGET